MWVDDMLKEQNALHIVEKTANEIHYLVYRPYKEYFKDKLRVDGKYFHTEIILSDSGVLLDVKDIDNTVIDNEYFKVD